MNVLGDDRGDTAGAAGRPARPGGAGRVADPAAGGVPVVRGGTHRLAGGTRPAARGGSGGAGGAAGHQRWRRAARIGWAGALIAGLAVYAGFAFHRSADRIEEKQTTVATAETLSAVADPLAALCAQDPTIRARVGAACDTAAQAVVAAPVVAAAARDGQPGADGKPGVDGVNGRDGRGITSTAIVAGRLVLTFSDGTTQDVGEVVGADGKAGVDGKAGTDGQPGTDGAAGAAGAPGGLPATYTLFFTDGTSQTCTRDGGQDSAPVYRCADRG